MSNENKSRFDNFVVGLITVQKYFDSGDNKIMKLEILMPKYQGANALLRRLLLKDFRTAVFSSNKKDDEFLEIALTNVSSADDEEVPE